LCDLPIVYKVQIRRPTRKSIAQVNEIMSRRTRKSISLFWIASFECIHDWLIFSTTLGSAATFHRETFHCKIDSRKCHRVLQRVSPFPFYGGEPPCYALNDDLVQLGFRVLDSPEIQAVRLGHWTYVEGHQYQAIAEIRDDLIEATTGERPYGTVRHPPPLRF
jgi:hypothetical protein